MGENSYMSEELKSNKISAPHLLQLDGLRGLAILLVATGHIFFKYYIFNFGWIGLNLFFLLSGYLITKRLFIHIQSNPLSYFKNFYVRRILRIFPLYYGILLLFFAVLPLIYIKYQQIFGSLNNIQIWYWLYISNWRIILYGLPPNPLFFHFWSLAVEEQFYLVWPIIFFLITSFNRRVFIILILLSLSILIRVFFYGVKAVYYNTLTPGEPLLLGCLISILEKNNKLKSIYNYARALAILSFISLVVIILYNSELGIINFPLLSIGYSNIDLIWAFLLCNILINLERTYFITKVFSSGILVWLGIYSYGIYVFHWIILQLFINKYENLFTNKGFSESISYWISRILGVIIILLLSYASYNLYERKFLALKKYFI